MKLRIHICFIAFASAALLAGCGAGFAPVKGEDKDVFFPSIRASYPLLDRENRHGLSDNALEFDLSRGRGSGRQPLYASETISLGGQTLTGPADVEQVFTLDTASAALRFRSPHEWGPIFIELLGGVLFTDLELRLQAGGLSAEQDFRDGGTFVGLGVGSQVTDYFVLAFRYTADLVPFNWSQYRVLKSIDFTASWWVTPQAALTGGFRHWKYKAKRDASSDIDRLVWEGFAAGLAFSF